MKERKFPLDEVIESGTPAIERKTILEGTQSAGLPSALAPPSTKGAGSHVVPASGRGAQY